MSNLIERKLNYMKQIDRKIYAVFFGGFVFAWFLAQGIPLWDDDFTSWFWKIQGQNIFTYIFQLISPISTQPQYWGFNERPIQAIIYKLFYMISGYESWSYFLFKDMVYGGLGVMIYLWTQRLVPQGSKSHLASIVAAVFFFVLPGPVASHIIHSDLAPLAELFFLISTYFIWQEVENTPIAWKKWTDISEDARKKWLKTWIIICVLTYFGYKSKADLKLIPVILAVYIYAVRRHQRFFAIPVGIMLLLAIPWGPGIFNKLPPFFPGSQGSDIGWMWHPASFSNLLDFLWAGEKYNFVQSLTSSTISLSALLGPFLFIGLIVFFRFQVEALDKVPWTASKTTIDRARIFVLIWFAAILVGVSALPPINYSFRVRYGILPAVPLCLLLGWCAGFFFNQMAKLPKWAVAVVASLFVIQTGINLSRSITYRIDMGNVMIAVDQVYKYTSDNFPEANLALFPDFRPYDYRPTANNVIFKKDMMNAPEDVAKKYPPGSTVAISWAPSFWEQLEMVDHFSGCRQGTLFNMIFRCPAKSGAYLMKYIGLDPLYVEGERQRSAGNIAGARQLHENFLAKYPKSLAGHFVRCIEAYAMKDWNAAVQSAEFMEQYFPEHPSVLYNHALSLVELNRFDEAIVRLKALLKADPLNYGVGLNLYGAYTRKGDKSKAAALLKTLKQNFPNDGEVNRLIQQAS